MDDRLRLGGFINDFNRWDDLINKCAVRFRKLYNVYPNILLAATPTYQKIDQYAQIKPESIYSEEYDSTFADIEAPFEGLSAFITDDYQLELCVDENMVEGIFSLLFDQHPIFDREPAVKKNARGETYRPRHSA
jgi:hypothetical protein